MMMTAGRVSANDFEDGDPVRNAQRLKDCIVQNVARQDGRTRHQIKRACVKAINNGTFKDTDISLDGMIKK
jgi:hypothetical protein